MSATKYMRSLLVVSQKCGVFTLSTRLLFALAVFPIVTAASAVEAKAGAESTTANNSEKKSVLSRFTGKAHYYADWLHGKRTASGQLHHREKLTAAHKTLPFGTRLKVTNKRNGKSCLVTVNDRGPHHPDYVLDVSQAAAEQLGFHGRGRAILDCQIVSNEQEPVM